MIRKCLAIGIILLFVGITLSPGINATISKTSEIVETSDDEYNFFSFAIIWGTFEIVSFNGFWTGLKVYNSEPDNNTLHIIGYVGYDRVGFIYRNASFVYSPWRLGIIHPHSLFVIAWGNSIRVW